MIKKIICFIVVVAVSGLSLVNGEEIKDWTYKYEGEKLPDKAGFFRNGKPIIAENSKAGIFHFSSIDSNKGAFYYRYVRSTEKIFLNSDTGYTIEFRAKIIKTDIKKNSSAIYIEAEDGRKDINKFWGLSFYTGADSNYLVLSGTTKAGSVAIGNDFHTYRITVKGDQVALFIDGTEACRVKASTKTATNQLRFGDLTHKADGDWEIDYLRIYTKGAVAPKK